MLMCIYTYKNIKEEKTMFNGKIKYILVLFIILSLSMNAFSATNFTDDSDNTVLQSSDSVDKVNDDGQADDSQADDGLDDQNQNNILTATNGSGGGKQSFGGNGSSFGGNGSGFSFGNGSSFGGNGSSFDLASLLDYFTKMMGGDNATNTTNATNATVAPEVSDVPKVATSTSYYPVSHPADVHKSQHTVTRVRDNKIVSTGDTLKLEGINKLYDSNFTDGHLLVYIDGKLVFNEITTNDLETPIFGITDSYLGQHQISVEFTSNADSNANTNKYTEDVMIS